MSDQDAKLVALASAGRRFVTVQTLDELYPLAAELALHLLEASSVSVARVEHEHGLLRVLRNAGELADWETPAPSDETYALADFPMFASTVEEAAPWFMDLSEGGDGPTHRLLREMGMYSGISLPVIVGSTVWGEVGATRTQDRPLFTDADLATGEAFSGLLGAAIARITVRDELHGLAYLDDLTGLANRRAIDERLEQLFTPPVPPTSVAVILGDVDGLKTINDQHGHDAGDRILRQVAGLLTNEAARHPGSLAARLGGDEFCLLLEGADDAEVAAASERLMVAAAQLPMGAGLSCGWSRATERPGDAETATLAARALLRLADAAQYRTKRGRGRPSVDHHAAASARRASLADPTVVEQAITALTAAGSGVEDRLEAMAAYLARVLDTPAWAVSVSVDGGPATIVRNIDSRRLEAEEGGGYSAGAAFDLADYPATAVALQGGSFHASLDDGDPTERAFLAASGHDESIGAGARRDERHAWLVELYGDALSRPLAPYQGVLRALVELAVAPTREVAASAQDRAVTSVGSGGSSA